MFYKLKTDLPTFKAGDLFYLDTNGSLRHKNTNIVAYHHTTLAKFPDALEKFWEPVEEEFKRWRAERGELYYCVDSNSLVASEMESRWGCDDRRHDIGNYFKSEAEAQAHVDYLKALATVRDDAKGFKPDWSDKSQEKFVVTFISGCLVEPIGVNGGFDGWAPNGVFGLPYFASYDDAKASIDKHEKEWKTIFGIEGEAEDDGE